jgi:hypothetical protein
MAEPEAPVLAPAAPLQLSLAQWPTVVLVAQALLQWRGAMAVVAELSSVLLLR